MNNSAYLNEAKVATSRWGKTGMLEGIKDDAIRGSTAVLLENQKLYNETVTDTSDIGQFKRIAIPLIRRVYPQLIANKIVAVQPLLGPTGLVFYLRFRYSSDKGATLGKTNNGGYPGDDDNSLMHKANGDANLDIWYSHQQVSNEVTSTDIGGDTTSVYSSLKKTPIFSGTVVGTVYDGSTAVQNFAVSAGGTFSFTDIGSPTAYATAGAINLETGEMTLTWNTDPGANHAVVSYEFNMECQPDIPEVNLAVESEQIGVKTRKLKAVWSFEAVQDLRSQHNLDAEAEITAVLAQEINLEIDREILGDLKNNAGTVAAWDYSTTLGSTLKEKHESLFIKVVELSAVIHRKTLRGGANWIVTSPEVASIFETATAGFAPAPAEGFTSNLGVQYVGTVNNRWKLYKDPLFQQNQLLMGYKGDTYMDSGYYYCPYIPLTQTPTIMDPDSFCPRKGILTRYGKKMLREGARFYARMNIMNFSIV